MSAPNMKMRDPLLYRIRNVPHHRAGDKWAIYPMYDFAHPLSDYIEGVTHSICTLEFENNREIYDWLLDTLELKPPRPYQHEFARLNINYTVMSKRKLLELVEGGYVNGWDDPRLPTIAGLRRRGYTPESILSFCDQIGIAKANSTVDVSQLEFAIRDDLNPKVPRVMCVLNPLKITITNYEGYEEIDASYYPHDVPREGSRKLPFSSEIYIDRDDFCENPPKGYYRLTPDQPVRLKHAYIISCQEVVKDIDGNITEIKAVYYPDSRSGSDTSGIKVKSAIQWVEAHHAVPAEVRLYDRLYKNEAPESLEDLNPDSLKTITGALVEPAVIHDKPDQRFQFERLGYFFADPVDYSDEKPVFNRIVTLKDSWTKKSKPKPAAKPKTNKTAPRSDGETVPMNDKERTLYEHYTKELGLGGTVAEMIARDEKLSVFFDAALQAYDSPANIANIVANEVSRELKSKEAANLNFTPRQIAELVKLIDSQTVSTKIAKDIFEIMATKGGDPADIVEAKGLRQISDPSEIMPIIEKIINANPENVQKYKEGNQKLFGFFVGQTLKATEGKANPKVVNELIEQKLK